MLFVFEHDGHDECAIQVVEMDFLIRITSCDTNKMIGNMYHVEVHIPRDLFLRLLAIMASSTPQWMQLVVGVERECQLA